MSFDHLCASPVFGGDGTTYTHHDVVFNNCFIAVALRVTNFCAEDFRFLVPLGTVDSLSESVQSIYAYLCTRVGWFLQLVNHQGTDFSHYRIVRGIEGDRKRREFEYTCDYAGRILAGRLIAAFG